MLSPTERCRLAVVALFLLVGDRATTAAASSLPNCQDANARCLYSDACRHAVQQFHSLCEDVVSGRWKHCTTPCRDATIVLLAGTEEGRSLWDCRCEDEGCEEIKRGVEVCRAPVLRQLRNDSSVPWGCGPAHAFCEADPVCAEALHYYFFNCRAMIRGRQCSNRCLNSISILSRQKHAVHLLTCVCDGTEAFKCSRVQQNTLRLCYPSKARHRQPAAVAPAAAEPPGAIRTVGGSSDGGPPPPSATAGRGGPWAGRAPSTALLVLAALLLLVRR